MGEKSQDSWNIDLCVRQCGNRGYACKDCFYYNNFITLNSLSIQRRLKIQKENKT